MSDVDLLSAVQPAEGWFAIVGIRGGQVRQTLVATREEADTAVADMLAQERDVYFGVAKYASDISRKKDNVSALKALWLDIDCGEDKAEVNPSTGRPKGYLTQADGLKALQTFCRAVKLPKPLLVNSGRGLHVYWPLTEEISRAEWEPLSIRLRDLCYEHDLYVDPAVFEAARILRVPGTLNYKDDPPKPVEIIHGGNPNTVSVLAGLLGVPAYQPSPTPDPSFFADPTSSGPSRPRTAMGQGIKDTRVNSFEKLLSRSKLGQGCAQVLDFHTNRATLEEPRWRAALSIAHICEDRDEAIRLVSEGHPDYTPAKAEAKAQTTSGALSCPAIEILEPSHCKGCKFKGKINGPIALAKEVVVATAADNIIQLSDEETIEIPEYPWPYFRAAGGGVWRKGFSEGEDDILVYRKDLYVVKRMRDPELKDVVVMRLHTLLDDIKTFMVPCKHVTEPTELRRILSSEGVMVGKKQFDLITDYVLKSVDVLQDIKRATPMRQQFGWADDNKRFILGDREITAEGVFHSPPSNTTSAMARIIGPVGEYDLWREAFNAYAAPGLEMHAFGACIAFGAPLMKFLGQPGVLINFINAHSGTGKTTILHMCNSVYGDPKLLCLTEKDTYNAKIQKLGVLNNLPACVDELTNMKGDSASDFVYTVGGGIGKDRMKMSSNELRENNSTWQTLVASSSNVSFFEKLMAFKDRPEGEMMRMMEYRIDYTGAIERERARDLFDRQLLKNYGHAGPVYLGWLVPNLETDMIPFVHRMQQKVDAYIKTTQRERYWSTALACIFAGGVMAKALGLHDFDMERVFRVVCDRTIAMRTEIPSTVDTGVGLIGDFIARHTQNILVVNDSVDQRSQMPMLPVLEPRGELLIRYEPDTGLMYINVKALREDLTSRQVSYRGVVEELTKTGAILRVDVKRMNKGTKVVAPPVSAVVFNAKSPAFNMADTLMDATVPALLQAAEEA